eukprot:606356-Rhodomonas_salina.1
MHSPHFAHPSLWVPSVTRTSLGGAEEEFNMEKLRLVEQEKVKVKTEFDRKNKQVEIKKRIDFSNEVRDAEDTEQNKQSNTQRNANSRKLTQTCLHLRKPFCSSPHAARAQVNASRLKVLQEREQVVQKVKDAVMQQLIAS